MCLIHKIQNKKRAICSLFILLSSIQAVSYASEFISLPSHAYTTFKETTLNQAVLNLKSICKKENMKIDLVEQNRLICSRSWSEAQKQTLPSSLSSLVLNPQTSLVFIWMQNQGNIDVDGSIYARYQDANGKSNFTIDENKDDLKDLEALMRNH